MAIDDIEWFASVQDIAHILARLRDGDDPAVLQILSVNPSVGEQEAAYWDYVGYKGGSESRVFKRRRMWTLTSWNCSPCG